MDLSVSSSHRAGAACPPHLLPNFSTWKMDWAGSCQDLEGIQWKMVLPGAVIPQTAPFPEIRRERFRLAWNCRSRREEVDVRRGQSQEFWEELRD